MTSADYLILGAGVAGTTAAETIRGRDAGGSIMLVGDEPHPLYSRVLMPHFVRGRVPEAGLFLKKPAWYAEKTIEYASGVAALKIDSEAKRVILSDGREVGYGKLLIATGGKPRRLDCPGAAEAGVLQLQTVDDARVLAAANAGPALVIGGGFIAMEFALSFAHKGIATTVATRGGGFWARLMGDASRTMIAEALARHGVALRVGSELESLAREHGRVRARFKDGANIHCAVVAAGIGIDPNLGFLKGSGIAVNLGVVTDEYLAASAPDVYAAGDVAEFFDLSAGGRHVLGNWANALFHGKTVGATMAGEKTAYSSLTSYSINCFELPIAFLGTVDPDDERIERRHDDAVIQCFLRDGRAVGATAVGKFHEREAVNALISKKVVFGAGDRSSFADAKVPLANFVP